MNSRIVFGCIFMLPLLLAGGLAQDPPQKEAEALLERARQLSDIRAPNAHPFLLKAKISFVSEDLESLEGTYTEVWVSESRWRRETVVGEKKRIEVSGPTRTWLLDIGNKDLPEQATYVPSVVNVLPAKSAKFEFESVSAASPQNTTTKCAITKPNGSMKVKYAFCFDARLGELIESVTPHIIRERPADYSCQYGNFMQFGERWFPRSVNCVLNGHRQLEVEIVDLSTGVPNDAALFTPPDGALEIGKCSGKLVAPKAVSTPDPSFPQGLRDRNSSVFLRLVVDVKGKPLNVKISKSGGKLFDDEAVRTVQRWRFKPATCDGEIMPMQIGVEISFRLSR